MPKSTKFRHTADFTFTFETDSEEPTVTECRMALQRAVLRALGRDRDTSPIDVWETMSPEELGDEAELNEGEDE